MTADVWQPHPDASKPDLWRIVGRMDDVVRSVN